MCQGGNRGRYIRVATGVSVCQGGKRAQCFRFATCLRMSTEVGVSEWHQRSVSQGGNRRQCPRVATDHSFLLPCQTFPPRRCRCCPTVITRSTAALTTRLPSRVTEVNGAAPRALCAAWPSLPRGTLAVPPTPAGELKHCDKRTAV